MNREEIIRMARNEYGIYAFTAESLAEFATIIAAAEREACAKVCEEIEMNMWEEYKIDRNPHFSSGSDGATVCAAAIRARGNT